MTISTNVAKILQIKIKLIDNDFNAGSGKINKITST